VRGRGRGCGCAAARLSCRVHRAEMLGPWRGAIRRGIEFADGPLAARVADGAALVRADESVDAARVAEPLDPDVDAHRTGADDGVEVLDVEVAHDVELIGVLRRVALPLLAALRVPGDDCALHVRG